MTRHAITILLFCEMLAVGCDSSTDNPPPDAGDASADASPDASPLDADTGPSPDGGPPVRFGTFNTGLAEGDVPNVAQRRQPIIDAVAASDLDLVCLQEVWNRADWTAIRTGLAARFPNTVRHPPMPPPAICSEAELAPLLACATANCTEAGADGLAACAVAHCGDELAALSPGCISCVTGHLAAGIDGIAMMCVETPDGGTPDGGVLDGGVLDGGTLDAGTLDAGTFDAGTSDGGTPEPVRGCIYDGAYDTAILTSLPIVEQESFALDSYLVCSAVDYARVTTPLGDVHVFCAHLASGIGTFPYRGAYGTWQGERTHEIGELLAFVASKAPAGSQVVLLGDFNTGAAVPSAGIVEQSPTDFQMITDSGVTDPYLTQSDVQCTVCPDNTMRDPMSSPTLIDHALIRGFTPGSARVQRIFDEPVTIDVSGTPTLSSLSDHYGLELFVSGGG